eukprot:10065523-Prorocentrum_lima.AAC.1
MRKTSTLIRQPVKKSSEYHRVALPLRTKVSIKQQPPSRILQHPDASCSCVQPPFSCHGPDRL